MYSPVSGMYNPASFLAPILISSPLKIKYVRGVKKEENEVLPERAQLRRSQISSAVWAGS